jgi:uncharacterized repeat protein (TIGR03803 family)
LFIFDGFDGTSPNNLILSGNVIYGTAGGTTFGAGTLFTFDINNNAFTNLFDFTGNNAAGAIPQGNLILSGKKIYGTTDQGGTFASGTVFSVNTDGTAFNTIYNFTDGTDGSQPDGLVLSGNILYGVTTYGGTNDEGTLFAVNTDGSNFTTLYTFSALSPAIFSSPFTQAGTNNDGAFPKASLILHGNVLYGTTTMGGSGGNGTVFALSLPIPFLSINTTGNQITLSWPISAGNFTLQASPDLSNWFSITNGVSIAGTNYALNETLTGQSAFFRLQAQ